MSSTWLKDYRKRALQSIMYQTHDRGPAGYSRERGRDGGAGPRPGDWDEDAYYERMDLCTRCVMRWIWVVVHREAEND